MMQQDKKKLGGQATELDSLVNMIDNKDKNINALQKTKIDWDKHTKEQKMEAELDKNRKDGYLGKQKFLNQAAAMEYAHTKKIEKIDVNLRNEKIKNM